MLSYGKVSTGMDPRKHINGSRPNLALGKYKGLPIVLHCEGGFSGLVPASSEEGFYWLTVFIARWSGSLLKYNYCSPIRECLVCHALRHLLWLNSERGGLNIPGGARWRVVSCSPFTVLPFTDLPNYGSGKSGYLGHRRCRKKVFWPVWLAIYTRHIPRDTKSVM